jgi:ATP-dependent exoDNAse (exonuclease V) beta subunit
VKLAAEEGAGMTPAGLATYLDGLKEDGDDERAFSPDADAVVISTWHGAKGLEWPIVILYELDWSFKRYVPDIHIASDRKRIDLGSPLAGRWIRYWPNPYHFKTKAGYHELMAEHPVVLEADGIERRESLRLLYVGWTRARDRVVLTSPKGKLGEGMLGEFREEGGGGGAEDAGTPLLSEPEEGMAEWGGTRIELLVREPSAVAGEPIKPEAEPTFVTEGPKEIAPASAWPDLTGMEWKAGKPEIIGAPIALFRTRGTREVRKAVPGKGNKHIAGESSDEPIETNDEGDELVEAARQRGAADAPFEPKDMGSAVHGFIAADNPEYEPKDRLKLAEDILARWKVTPALTPADLVEISDRLRRWAGAKWPKAKWHREWPTYQRLDTGSIASGIADLILETPDGLIIIDHKAYGGVPGDAAEYALGDAPQVQVYADTAALATGKPILGMYIHFPLIGALVGLSRK